MSVRQKLVRDVARYVGHDSGVALSKHIIGSNRPACVSGKVNSPSVNQAIGTYQSGFATATDLCRIMHGLGSDKGVGRHNYGLFYTELLKGRRDQALNIFELGIGTNNPKLKSTMGRRGRPGASLYGWRDYLPAARIYAADIDRAILFQAERISCFYCDQTSAVSVAELWKNPQLRDVAFDLIIDDGLHEFDANRTFLEGSWGMLRSGGLLIVEDILGRDRDRWLAYVADWNAARPDAPLAFIELPHPYNFVSNNIACLEKP